MQIGTNYGKIESVRKEGYTVFKGIPYAKPPIDELRFREPQEPDCWEGIYKADTFAGKCPQEESGFSLYTKEFYSDSEYLREDNEDCLYINIWVPEGAKDAPVAFWIHGGGFGGGYGSEIEFDGEEYCKRGVILVTIQYRVNIYGFLAHPWLSAESVHGVSGNYGVLDQIAALKWVRENIAAFGGDPKHITIFGQSAGSASVQCLASTRLTSDWIDKAIIQSGGGYKPTYIRAIPLKEAERIGEKFTHIANVHNLEELRALTVDKIKIYSQKLTIEMRKETDELFLLPNVDGYVLEDSFEELVRKGMIKGIPYMIGSVKHDLGITEEELKSDTRGALHLGCMNWSLHMEKLYGKPAYVYYFEHRLPGDDREAFHSSELWYMFGTLKRCWRPMAGTDYQLSGQMVDYWTNFIKTGAPGSVDGQPWNACTNEEPFVKVFR